MIFEQAKKLRNFFTSRSCKLPETESDVQFFCNFNYPVTHLQFFCQSNKSFESLMLDLAEAPMCSSWCLSRHSLLFSVAVLIFLLFSGFLGFGFSSIPFTFTTLILSTVLLFTLSKQRPILKQNARENLQEMEVGQIDNYLVRSPAVSTSEDSEVDWPFPGNVGQTPECSDDSISDDDSLIEIALSNEHYVCPKEEPKLKSGPNCPEFLPESIFRQQGLMELLAEINEMNEEENLIEIDISIGSIKCSRFEIEA